MPTPAKFTVQQILDAALAEISESGVDGASVAAIGRRLGAPNGSMYHRFPSRQHLIGALWISVAGSYRETLVEALEETDVAGLSERVVSHTFDWVAASPARAQLLMRFRTEDFTPGDWPADVVARITETNQILAGAVFSAAQRLGLPPLDVLMAVIDVPAAAARRSVLLGDADATEHLRLRAVELVDHLLGTVNGQP